MSEQQRPKELIVQIKCLKPIEDYIYSTMNHTPEWEQAERAFQYVLHSRPHSAPAPDRYIDENTETPCTQEGIALILKSAERAKHPAPAPSCHAKFVPITQDEYDYLMKGWGNEHTEQIDEDVRQRQAAYINCCNCGVPKTSDGEPNCNECAFSEEHDAALIRKAREDVLDKIIAEFRKRIDLIIQYSTENPDEENHETRWERHLTMADGFQEAVNFAESLRQPSKQEQP